MTFPYSSFRYAKRDYLLIHLLKIKVIRKMKEHKSHKQSKKGKLT